MDGGDEGQAEHEDVDGGPPRALKNGAAPARPQPERVRLVPGEGRGLGPRFEEATEMAIRQS